MKILQGGFLIIVGVFLTSAFAKATATKSDSVLTRGTSSGMLAEADSLFRLKQYTQSFELYQSIFQNKRYSPAMLLKMAYIQEGLGHIGQSMYFLNLYYLATSDPQALSKIEDVAAKNKLEGYKPSSTEWIWTILRNFGEDLQVALAALCIISLAWMFRQKYKQRQRPVASGITLLAFLVILAALNSFKDRGKGIVASDSTYLMSGPSAGATVVSIVGEGHRLEILGRKDVWLRVSWLEKEAYVKESELLPVAL